MMSVDRLSQIGSPAAVGSGGALDAGTVARGVMETVGQRVAAWSGEIFGGQNVATTAGFSPDTNELSRRGDVYDLRSLVSETAARYGAAPAAEGELLRATEDFTRAAALHIFGGDRADTVTRALESASSEGSGLDGVIGHLEAATRDLRTTAGN